MDMAFINFLLTGELVLIRQVEIVLGEAANRTRYLNCLLTD